MGLTARVSGDGGVITQAQADLILEKARIRRWSDGMGGFAPDMGGRGRHP